MFLYLLEQPGIGQANGLSLLDFLEGNLTFDLKKIQALDWKISTKYKKYLLTLRITLGVISSLFVM